MNSNEVEKEKENIEIFEKLMESIMSEKVVTEGWRICQGMSAVLMMLSRWSEK